MAKVAVSSSRSKLAAARKQRKGASMAGMAARGMEERAWEWTWCSSAESSGMLEKKWAEGS